MKIKGKCIVRSNVIIRGEYSSIVIGRYVHINEGCVVRPGIVPITDSSNQDIAKAIPMTIGSHVSIGKKCVVEAAWIGTNVIVGDGCVISKRVIIKDNCKIVSNSIIPPGMVIPPFSVVAGCPARIVGELTESVVVDIVDQSLAYFDQFVYHLSKS